MIVATFTTQHHLTMALFVMVMVMTFVGFDDGKVSMVLVVK